MHLVICYVYHEYVLYFYEIMHVYKGTMHSEMYCLPKGRYETYNTLMLWQHHYMEDDLLTLEDYFPLMK